MTTEPPCQRFFLSYSRADEKFALRLATDLRSNGVSIWVDQLDIRPSEHWDRAIEQAVRDCCGLVVLLSPRSAASDNVADEISFAIDHGKAVLPVMIEQCRLPLRITRMQVIDATGDYAQALERCLDGIRGPQPNSATKVPPTMAKGVDDQEAIASAKRELTAILGPIASILVDKEAARAGSVADLRAKLAAHISNGRDRERFTGETRAMEPTAASPVKSAPATARPTPRPAVSPLVITNQDVDRLSKILTSYLGPVATVIARRESAEAASAEDLERRLSLRIPDAAERAEFLNRVHQR